MTNRWFLGALCILSSCHYTLIDHEDAVTVGVPFVEGDMDGRFTSAVIEELTSASFASFSSRGARYKLELALTSEPLERSGFRYDREADGSLKPNIIGTETRKTVSATLEVVDTLYDKVVWGPKTFSAERDFDYVDSDNIADMSFVNPLGERVLVFNYSLGQLNTIEGAQDAASVSIYKLLSKKIIDELALFFNTQQP